MVSARLNWIWTPLILWWNRYYFHIIPKCKLQASTFKSKHQPDLWNLTSTPFHVSTCTSDIMKCNPDIMKSPSLSRNPVASQKRIGTKVHTPVSCSSRRTLARPRTDQRKPCALFAAGRWWRSVFGGRTSVVGLRRRTFFVFLLLSVRTDPGCSTGLGLLLGPASLLPARNLPLSFALRVRPRQSFVMVGLFPFQMAIHGL